MVNGGVLEMKLILKYGFDGSTFTEYKQKFAKEGSSDSSVFLTSLVPLQLSNGEIIVWDNPRPSSTRYCRPVFLQLIKETAEETVKEHNRMQKEIARLIPLCYDIDDFKVKVRYDMIMTMIDGKTINAVTGNTFTHHIQQTMIF